MFQGCISLEEMTGTIPLTKNTKVMFQGCTKLAFLSQNFMQNLKNSGRTDNMFYSCTSLTAFKGDVSASINADSMFNGCSNIEEIEADMPKAQRAWNICTNCKKLVRFKSNFSDLVSLGSGFNGCSSLSVFEADLPKLGNSEAAFGSCILNKESVLRICNSLPTYTSGTWKITLGIHIDHQYDEEVLAAIALIDKAQTPVADGGKGWTVAVQWNGTASTAAASTYRWGGRRDPVYAKLAEPFENEPPALDWGHYVTNWEENGYMEFASIEEAREYFNIIE
jgi:hypothetical protein